MLEIPPPEELELFLRSRIPDRATLEVELLPTGVLFLTSRLASGRVVALQGDAARVTFGLDPDLPADAAFEVGYPVVVSGYQQAIEEWIKEVQRN